MTLCVTPTRTTGPAYTRSRVAPRSPTSAVDRWWATLSRSRGHDLDSAAATAVCSTNRFDHGNDEVTPGERYLGCFNEAAVKPAPR